MKTIIDKSKVEANRNRARNIASADAGFLLDRLCSDLEERLAVQSRVFSRAICLAPDPARVAEAVMRSGKVEQIGLLSDGMASDAIEDFGLAPASADLLVSVGHLHETNDLPGALVQFRRALKPDGLFIGCMPGAGTLGELRDSLLRAEADLGTVSARVLPFADVRDSGALLQRAGFALPVTDSEPVAVRYGSIVPLIGDLRAMGQTNSLTERSRKPMTRAALAATAVNYANHHADPDGRLRATFNFIWMSGWAPHESQPKPLKPGSATHSLAEALKDKSAGS